MKYIFMVKKRAAFLIVVSAVAVIGLPLASRHSVTLSGSNLF